jgi:hypothetical protein
MSKNATLINKLSGTALVALLGVPLAFGPASAQQSDTTGSEQSSQSGDMNQSQTSGTSADSGQGSGNTQTDAVVATVGDAEIRGSDLLTVIGILPSELQSQPPQMLIPIALEQLIFRELIIEQALSEGLAEDPEVAALVGNSAQTAQEDALVQVWLDRRQEAALTDEAVQQAYDDAQAQNESLPPLEQVRPQIEEFLRQQAVQASRMELQQGADIVLYDATGRPMEQQADQTGTTSSGTDGSATNGQSGDDAGSDEQSD